jgi:hypothetical protein
MKIKIANQLPNIVIVLTLIVMASCNKNIMHTTAHTMQIGNSNIIHLPVLVDLITESQVVTGSFKGKTVDEQYAKNMAVANALKTSEADALINPVYELTLAKSSIAVEVKGYPAKYSNFRSQKSINDAGSNIKLNFTTPR